LCSSIFLSWLNALQKVEHPSSHLTFPPHKRLLEPPQLMIIETIEGNGAFAHNEQQMLQ